MGNSQDFRFLTFNGYVSQNSRTATAGTTNSLIGSVRFAVGAIMGSLVASMKMDTAAPMLFTMGACVVISVLAYYFLTSRNLKKSERK